MNWYQQPNNVTYNLNDIYIDSLNGFIAADSGFVLKTTNAGTNWSVLYPFNYNHYRALHFFNSNTGCIIGSRTYSVGIFPRTARILLKTTNAGMNWTTPLNEDISGFYHYNDIFFLNNQQGWIVSDNSGIGRTTNGGDNWFSVQNPVNGSFKCVQFINDNFGWIGGTRGTVLSTSSPIGIQVISTKIPSNFSLSQNYPNPFNPQTKIKFDVLQVVKGKIPNVKLVIYDMLGREVATLVNEQLRSGSYEIDWDGSNYSSGVYFYKIVSGDFVETRKMVLMK